MKLVATLLTLTALMGCATVTPQPINPIAPIVITEPTKCPVLDASLLVIPSMPPSRELQGTVPVESKVEYLEDWLNDSLQFGRVTRDQLELLIEQVTCND